MNIQRDLSANGYCLDVAEISALDHIDDTGLIQWRLAFQDVLSIKTIRRCSDHEDKCLRECSQYFLIAVSCTVMRFIDDNQAIADCFELLQMAWARNGGDAGHGDLAAILVNTRSDLANN